MQFHFTLKQARYLNDNLPDGFQFQSFYRNQEDQEEINKNRNRFETKYSPENMEDLKICQIILTKLKKTSIYKQLTSDDQKVSYNKYFLKSFSKFDSFYKNNKNDALLMNNYIVARFWKDFTTMIKDCQCISSKEPRTQQSLIELENQFNSIFIQFQHQCLEQTGAMMLEKVRSAKEGKKQIYITQNLIQTEHKLRPQIGLKEKDKEDLHKKINKVPIHNLKYLIDVIGIQNYDIQEIDLDQIDCEKFRKLQTIFKLKAHKQKKIKLEKRYGKKQQKKSENHEMQLFQQEYQYDEYSNQSFLSCSDDYI